jgi:hypothetical protein
MESCLTAVPLAGFLLSLYLDFGVFFYLPAVFFDVNHWRFLSDGLLVIVFLISYPDIGTEGTDGTQGTGV